MDIDVMLMSNEDTRSAHEERPEHKMPTPPQKVGFLLIHDR